MKQALVIAALLVGGPALAQPSMADQTNPGSQPTMSSQTMTQGAGVAGPVAIPRSDAVAPPEYNQAMRDVPPEQAAQIINQLTSFDYPPCSRQVQDRCLQAYARQ